MLKLAADENLNQNILTGLRSCQPDIDLLGVREAGLTGAKDPTVLEWAAREGRVLLSHDVNTMPNHAYHRVRAGQPMPGVFIVPEVMGIGEAIEEILLIAGASNEGEYEG